MNNLCSILLMSSSFGATTMISKRWLLSTFLSGATIRSAASFAVHPPVIARHQMQYQQHRKTGDRLFFQSVVLTASPNTSNENEEIVPTWEYVPYDPSKKNSKKPVRRTYNTKNSPPITAWTVPKHLSIPEDRLEISFVRSSGSGGQNVNKLSTKVELRLDLNSRQTWMPAEVQRRLREQQSNKTSKEGILTITAQEHRTQGMNRKSAVDKLRKMVLLAWPRPKVRKQRKGISKAAKARNKDFKKRRSETKQNRRRVDW